LTIQSKVMFPIDRFRNKIYRPLGNTSRREALLRMLRLPVITWPVGLYMNGEFRSTIRRNFRFD
jgi:hypothetical protein